MSNQENDFFCVFEMECALMDMSKEAKKVLRGAEELSAYFSDVAVSEYGYLLDIPGGIS